MLRKVAEIVRQNARELAAIDAIDCGNPFTANYLPRLVIGGLFCSPPFKTRKLSIRMFEGFVDVAERK